MAPPTKWAVDPDHCLDTSAIYAVSKASAPDGRPGIQVHVVTSNWNAYPLLVFVDVPARDAFWALILSKL